MEAEKETLALLNTIIDGEKRDLESEIAGLETQRASSDKEAEELKVRVMDWRHKTIILRLCLRQQMSEKWI